MSEIDVLLCYRGRYHQQIERMDELLEAFDLTVTFDSEILTEGVEYTEAEIEWLPLGGSSDDDDVAWRAPLSAAVERSELVVFLVDPQDPSDNVMNEIAWAARAAKPLFLVFNSKSDTHSEDWEGMNIGMLQAFYGLSTGTPDAPAFGYHFVTHEEDEGLDARLTVLVNRIVSYLERVRSGSVGRVRLDDGTTLAEVENRPVARARRHLRSVQEEIARGVGGEPFTAQEDQTQATLALLYERERDGVVRGGRVFPRNSPFSFPVASERERYRLTEALVSAIRPGPYEVSHFLAMYARELVSIQMTLGRSMRESVLIGTLPLCPSNLPVDCLLKPDYAVLLVDTSQTDLVYQMLKPTVMAWKVTSPPGKLPVSQSTRTEDIKDVIASNPDLVAGFTRGLKRMLEHGTPGSSTDGSPPAAYHPAITLLGVFAKRFGVAVALSRIVVMDSRSEVEHRMREQSGRSLSNTDLMFTADAIATQWVLGSAASLDSVDPTVAIQGVFFALAVQSLIEGSFPEFDPPLNVTAAARSDEIGKFFVKYQTESGESEEQALARLEGGKKAADTLKLLWQTARENGQLDPAGLRPATRWRKHIEGSADRTPERPTAHHGA